MLFQSEDGNAHAGKMGAIGARSDVAGKAARHAMKVRCASGQGSGEILHW
jgi:hypothetical protein